ncbi:hypothetical protein WN944_019008 [Citrus x changshan-huyou]|uniref:Uncharacterized protein n=1 Tax=Citrus x changshan-huyou TaxID=2935761 RepID=A0AAP0QEQ7_9ROSI
MKALPALFFGTGSEEYSSYWSLLSDPLAGSKLGRENNTIRLAGQLSLSLQGMEIEIPRELCFPAGKNQINGKSSFSIARVEVVGSCQFKFFLLNLFYIYRNSTRSKGSIRKFNGGNLCNRSMGNSKLSGAGGRSKLILGTAAASTGTRKRHDSEDQSISIYKNEKHCLRHATPKKG